MIGFIKGVIYLLGSMVAFGITVGIVIAGLDYADKYFAEEETVTVLETPSVSKSEMPSVSKNEESRQKELDRLADGYWNSLSEEEIKIWDKAMKKEDPIDTLSEEDLSWSSLLEP